MGRFFFWFIVFSFITGITIHYKVDVPYFLSWIGNLPGDMIIKKGNTLFYFPVTSAAIFALVITIIFSSFSKKK